MNPGVAATTRADAMPLRSERSLLWYAALLSGVGARADAILEALEGEALGGEALEGEALGSEALDPETDLEGGGERAMPQAVVRTCIEGRSHHLLSLAAPGERCLHVVFRTGLTRAGTTRWVHRRETPQGGEGWVTEVFSPGKPEAWTHTQALAQSLGTEGRLRAVHAVLGTRGRILTLSRGQAPGRASVGWQLDRCASPVEALTACGFGGAWPEAASILKELFGLVPQPRSGPWTIELPLLEADTGLRLGTTAWARCAEDTGKRRRLVALVERLGGDSRYAEALYKLVISVRAEGDLPAVGRAVELELAGDGVRSVALFLALPNTGEVSHHQGSERKSNRELERRGP